MRDCLGVDRLTGARRPGKAEGKGKAGRMALPETPLTKDQIVAGDLRQRLIQCADRLVRQDDVAERAARDD